MRRVSCHFGHQQTLDQLDPVMLGQDPCPPHRFILFGAQSVQDRAWDRQSLGWGIECGDGRAHLAFLIKNPRSPCGKIHNDPPMSYEFEISRSRRSHRARRYECPVPTFFVESLVP